VVAKTFPPDKVRAVLKSALYMQSSYREVLRRLLEGLQWLAGPLGENCW
jgi:hypothetical protein